MHWRKMYKERKKKRDVLLDTYGGWLLLQKASFLKNVA